MQTCGTYNSKHDGGKLLLEENATDNSDSTMSIKRFLSHYLKNFFNFKDQQNKKIGVA
jgi:hypothetical protein